jgi:hypothetical protein
VKTAAKPVQPGAAARTSAPSAPKAPAVEQSAGGFSFDLTSDDDLDAEFTNYAAKKDRAA